jgi:hypothetical protein
MKVEEILPKNLLSKCKCLNCRSVWYDQPYYRIIGTNYFIADNTFQGSGFIFSEISLNINSSPDYEHHYIQVPFEKVFDGVSGEVKDIFLFNLDMFKNSPNK